MTYVWYGVWVWLCGEDGEWIGRVMGGGRVNGESVVTLRFFGAM